MTPSITEASASSSRESIGAALASGRNSFGAMRLALASLVLFAHAYPLGGWGGDPIYAWTRGQLGAGTLAVLGFFAISGYLIAISSQSGSLIRFARRRAARLLPAYWVALVVTALVIAPLAWASQHRPFATYFNVDDDSPYSYITNNLLLFVRQWGINDVFLTTPFGASSGIDSVNGSIWTLIYEAGCYMLVGVTMLVFLRRHQRVLIPLMCGLSFVILTIMVVAPEAARTVLPGFITIEGMRLVPAFLIGATIAVFREWIPASRVIASVAGVIVIATAAVGGFWLVGLPAFCYLVLWLAHGLPRRLRHIGVERDFSYGVYLYAWPVQQLTVVWGWHSWGYVAWTLASLCGATILAFGSWYLVERPAMRWRRAPRVRRAAEHLTNSAGTANNGKIGT